MREIQKWASYRRSFGRMVAGEVIRCPIIYPELSLLGVGVDNEKKDQSHIVRGYNVFSYFSILSLSICVYISISVSCSHFEYLLSQFIITSL